MANDRIGLDIDLSNREVVLEAIKEIESRAGRLNGKKIKFAVDDGIKRINQELNQLTRRKIDIKVEMNSKIKEFENRILRIQNKKISLQMDYAKVSAMQKELGAADSEVKQLRQDFNKKWGINHNINELISEMGKFSTEEKRVRADLKDFKINSDLARELEQANETTQGLRNSLASLLRYEIAPKFDFKQAFQSIARLQNQLGAAMQTAGNALQNLTSPVNRLMTGAIYGAGYKALNKVTEGFGKAFSRYDTMEKYPKMMAEFETANYTAKDSIEELDKSVIGLPTGLDEIVDMAQRFSLSTQDMKKGTKYAIAANNAFLASMATDTQKYQGMMQLQDLLNGKELNSREWMSLGSSMGKAINEVGKVMGYTDMGKFRQELYESEIATEDFLDALVKVGTGSGSIKKLAENSKTTFEGLSSNITNAFSRMGYNVLKILDQIFEQQTGKTLIGNMLEIPKAIDKISDSAQNWVKSHPEEIKKVFDAIRNFDYMGALKGLGEGLKWVFDLIKKLAGVGGKLGLDSGNILKFMIQLNVIGKMLTGVGGLVKGTSVISGFVGAIGKWVKHIATYGGLADLGAITKLESFFSEFASIGEDAKKAQTAKDATTKALYGIKDVGNASQSTWGSIGKKFAKGMIPAAQMMGYAGSFVVVGKALEKIANMNIPLKETTVNLAKISGAAAAMELAGMGIDKMETALSKIKPLKGASAISGLIDMFASGGAMWLLAKAMQEMQKINMTWNDWGKRMLQMAAAVGSMEALAIAIGALNSTFLGGFALLGTGSIAALAGDLLLVAKALRAMEKIEIPSDATVDKVKKAIRKVSEIAEAFQSEGTGLKQRFKSWNDSKTMKHYSDTIGNLLGIIKTVNGMADELKKMTDLELMKADINNAVNNVTKIAEGVSAFMEVIQGLFVIQEKQNYGGTRGRKGKSTTTVTAMGLTTEELGLYNKQLGTIKETFTKLQEIATEFGNIKKMSEDLRKKFGVNSETDEIVTTQIEKAISSFTKMIDAITNEETGLGALDAATKRMEDVNLEQMTASLEEIPKIINKLNEIKGMLAGNEWLSSEAIVPANSFTSNLPGLGDAKTQQANGDTRGGVLDLISGLVEMMQEIARRLNAVPDFREKAKELRLAMRHLQVVMIHAQQLQDYVNGNIDVAAIKEKISSIITELGGVVADSMTFRENAYSFRMGAYHIQQALTYLNDANTSDLPTINSALSTLTKRVGEVSKAVQGKGAEWKKQLADGFKGTADAIKTEMDRVKQQLANISFQSAGWSAGNTFVTGFNQALSNITLPSLPTFSTSSSSSGGEILTAAKGGVVPRYLANGGPTLFKRKGTDTIPAMLTPHEFVVTRQAHSAVGTDFLNRINSLDLKGALASLSLRAGAMVSSNKSVNIDNSKTINTTNHQTFNVKTNNPGFAEMVAGRALRGLS